MLTLDAITGFLQLLLIYFYMPPYTTEGYRDFRADDLWALGGMDG